LPIIETQAGDITTYIPTNVISITDGQIFLESELFYAGIRPAVNPGISVSRVGGDAQVKAMKQVAGKIRIELAQYRELEAFAQFGSELDKETQERLEHGERIVEILKQGQHVPIPVEKQIIIIYAVINRYLADIKIKSIARFEAGLSKFMDECYPEIIDSIAATGKIDEEIEPGLKQAIEEFKEQFLESEK
jgi:F-type H+-transporting ATPase subunit alpha